MKSPNDGGPVFPEVHLDHDDRRVYRAGLTVRDYFAAKAMERFAQRTPEETAKVAYAVADAMLAERAK